MGKEDSAIKQWLSNSVRFADLFNAIVFEGKQIVKPEKLQQIDGESNIIVKNKSQGKSKKGVAIKRFRDIIMRWNNDVDLIILACEAQSYIDYAMPIRTMMYDALSYNEQKNNIWNNLAVDERKKLSSDEKLSSFRKEDKIIPTITLVFYYNDKEWDGAIELFDMFKFKDEESKEFLKDYIPNYKVNLINLSNIKDFSNFKSDLHIIFNMLKYKCDKKKLYDYTMEHEEYFRHISNDTVRALGELLNATELFEEIMHKNEEEQDMCKALYDMINDSKAEGREEGREEERSHSIESFINALKRNNFSMEAIKEALYKDYGLSENEIVEYMK